MLSPLLLHRENMARLILFTLEQYLLERRSWARSIRILPHGSPIGRICYERWWERESPEFSRDFTITLFTIWCYGDKTFEYTERRCACVKYAGRRFVTGLSIIQIPYGNSVHNVATAHLRSVCSMFLPRKSPKSLS